MVVSGTRLTVSKPETPPVRRTTINQVFNRLRVYARRNENEARSSELREMVTMPGFTLFVDISLKESR